MEQLQTLLAQYWPHMIFAATVCASTAAVIHAAMTKRDVRAAIGWVGVVLFSPLLGALLYFVAGVNRIRYDRVPPPHNDPVPEQPANRLPDRIDVSVASGPQFASLKTLGDHVSLFPLVDGNSVQPLQGGDEAYPAMIAAIESARHSIALQTYIFDRDAVGRKIAQALIDARQRGVEVRVLIDAIGAKYSRPPINGLLSRAKVRNALFMSSGLGLRLAYANLRSHRKILVVDGRIGFTGGMNIRAGFTTREKRPALRDTHFRLEGPVVAQLMASFAHDWAYTERERLQGELWFPTVPARGSVPARCVLSGPDKTLNSTHDMILGALAVAQRHVRIQSPYFLPDLVLIGALATAARRGVQVDIVIPGKNNLRLVSYAMTAQLEQVVRTGCRVWVASGPFDHSKLISVDGAWSYIGSSNLDPRSLRLNFELDMEIYDKALAAWIERRIDSLIATARLETLEHLRGMAFLRRLRNRVIWLASPYL
ncbi:phospholipase D-like domain-containing protein [Orrella sp. JC864]|uniref:phospholipase D-like domain-containing protein n=1 Tax=Orrella sp. JC864 TaxID=3120298 RepID=UPI0012BCAA76